MTLSARIKFMCKNNKKVEDFMKKIDEINDKYKNLINVSKQNFNVIVELDDINDIDLAISIIEEISKTAKNM